VQRAWMRAWNLNKDKVDWDAKAQCFRVSKNRKNIADETRRLHSKPLSAGSMSEIAILQ
jgi:hypothetical protein